MSSRSLQRASGQDSGDRASGGPLVARGRCNVRRFRPTVGPASHTRRAAGDARTGGLRGGLPAEVEEVPPRRMPGTGATARLLHFPRRAALARKGPCDRMGRGERAMRTILGVSSLVVVLGAAGVASAQTPISLTVSGNEAQGTIALPGGIAADLTITLENPVGLSPTALDASAQVVNPLDAGLLARLPA